MNALEKAIEIAGGTTALAKRLGVHKNVVTNWKTRGVPIDQCPAIEKATDRAVLCEQLNGSIDWAYIRGSHQPA
jgi:DNA-binding transcriptional regulator YdaS (Cro superfamily)